MRLEDLAKVYGVGKTAGCGDLKFYDDIVQVHDRCMGGINKGMECWLPCYDYGIDDRKNSYEKPQEYNSRVDTKWLKFSADGVDFEVSADKFSFCITRHDVNEDWKQKHKKDAP